MGIAQTGAIYKSLEFDGESSRDYGVYITGEAVYNAPKRDVEMISIPGRNGSYALDKGRFENIEVTYPAGIFADNDVDFAEAISDFRNFLCSRNGYVKLTDDYNPTEYRMAVYKSGLEVTPALMTAGEFDITFECMPQRWLMSGETPLSVTSGDIILNPTLFDAKPMLEVEGYGKINIGDDTITIYSGDVGTVTILSGYKRVDGTTATTSLTLSLDYSSYSSLLNSGDDISGTIYISGNGCKTTSNSITITSVDGVARTTTSYSWPLAYSYSGSAFPGSNATTTTTDSHTIALSNGTTFTHTCTMTVVNKTSGVIEITAQVTQSPDATAYCTSYVTRLQIRDVTAESTVTSLGNPTYIDLDIGEAYKTEGSATTSLNNTVTIPSELPVLSPGSNTITFDNTVTDLKVVPRWWKV